MNTNKTNKQRKVLHQSMIAAVVHVSESEIKAGYDNYDASWETTKPYVLKQILWDFGLNTNQDYVRQDGLQHRNRLGNIVVCSRWYGSERHDAEWLKSGYASQAAIDKAKNNKLLDDSYRMRHLTTDAQYALEQRDRNDKIED